MRTYTDQSKALKTIQGGPLYQEEYWKIREAVISKADNFEDLTYVIDRVSYHLSRHKLIDELPPSVIDMKSIYSLIHSLPISLSVALAILEQIGNEFQDYIFG